MKPYKRHTRLPPESREELRRRRRAGELLKVLAPEFGVCEHTICRIARRG